MAYTHSKKLLLATSISLALSGCGGGGGAAPRLTLPEGEMSILSATEVQAARGGVEDKLEDIRTSVPIDGSVSQSTNINGSDVTQDAFNVGMEGPSANPVYTIEYDADADGTAEDTITIDTSPSNLKSDEDFDPVDGSIYETLIVGGETGRPFDANGDGADEGRILILAASNYEGDDTDYVAAGLWVYVPDSYNIDEFALGAFADGGTKFEDIASQSGTARYEGGAFGFATLNHPRLGLQLAPFSTRNFDDVVLTATFGLNPRISGTINRLRNGILEEGGSDIPGTIFLREADIGDTGFFKGELDGTVGGIRLTGGNWGGQFYGTGGQWVTGTAGGGGTGRMDGEDVDLNFVATYMAERQ